MNTYFVRWVIPLLAVQATLASGPSVSKQTSRAETVSHFFISADLLAFIDEESYPAVSVSKNRIAVSKDGEIKELKMSAPIGLELCFN